MLEHSERNAIWAVDESLWTDAPGDPDVTPAMVDAGMYVFSHTYPDSSVGDQEEEEMMRVIYRAMFRASR